MNIGNHFHQLSPEKSFAILIGISRYNFFEDVEPVANNIETLTSILCNEEIFGISDDDIVTITSGSSGDVKKKVMEAVEQAGEAGKETVLLYFAGHGVRCTNGDYYLAVTESEQSLINLDGESAVPFDTIQTIVKSSKIRQSIFILDACYSGAVAQGEISPAPDKAIKGSYMVTATSSTEKAYFDKDDQFTVFTGELIQILEGGIDNRNPWVTLEELYVTLKSAVVAKNGNTTPQQRISQEIVPGSFEFFKNQAYDGLAEELAKIENAIQGIMDGLKSGDYDTARRTLIGLKAELLESLEPSDRLAKMIEVIDEEIEVCKFYPKCKPYIESGTLSQIEQELQEVQIERENLKLKLKDTTITLKSQVSVQKKQLGELQQSLSQKVQELSSTKAKVSEAEREASISKSVVEGLYEDLGYIRGLIRDEGLGNPGTLGNLPTDQSITIGSESIKMVYIEGGPFLMGSEEHDPLAHPDEKPQHAVTIPSFYLAEIPVTQRLWRTVMGGDPPELYLRDCMDCPIECVSWDDVQLFISRLNDRTGNTFRIPTESEWEFVARGGLNDIAEEVPVPGGIKVTPAAWYARNSNGKAHPVKGYAPNKFGLYDMIGNVWELCQDLWHENYIGAPNDGSAWEMQEGKDRVLRGGSWREELRNCRITSRNFLRQYSKFVGVGFRLAHFYSPSPNTNGAFSTDSTQ